MIIRRTTHTERNIVMSVARQRSVPVPRSVTRRNYFSPSRADIIRPPKNNTEGILTMKHIRTVLYALFLLSPFSVNAADADAIVGTWTTGEGVSKVEISKSGDTYSGKIVWLKYPTYPTDPAN